MGANFRTILGRWTVVAIATAAAACTPDGPGPSAMVERQLFETGGVVILPNIKGIADVDGDGTDDVFYANGGVVRWYSGADGSEIRRFDTGAGSSPTNVGTSLPDVDLDGLPEVLVPTGDDTSPSVSVLSGATGLPLYTRPLDEVALRGVALDDLDGDEVADFALSQPRFDGPGGENSGGVWTYSGADGTLIYFVDGPAGSRFGESMANHADCDGDGVAEFLVGAPWADERSGRSYILDGATGAVQVSNFGILERFGTAVSGGKDVDGDGVADYAVGAPGFVNASGRVSLFSGATGAFRYLFFGELDGDELGWVVELVDDVDGDGRADIAVGAPIFGHEEICTIPCGEICCGPRLGERGKAYLYSGRTGRLVHRWVGEPFEGVGSGFTDIVVPSTGIGRELVMADRGTRGYLGPADPRPKVVAYSYDAPGACTDLDGDGYGGPSGTEGCPFPGIDCDDADPAENPGAVEAAGNFKDDNCNGLVDEAPWCSVAAGADRSPWTLLPILAPAIVLLARRRRAALPFVVAISGLLVSACTPEGPGPSRFLERLRVEGVPATITRGVEDVDGDAVQDLFLARDGHAEFRAGADGTLIRQFDAPFEYQLGLHSQPGDVLDDLDHDGVPEIALASSVGVDVFSGLTGEIAYEAPTLGGSPSVAVALGDLTFDGIRDIAVGDEDFEGPGGATVGRVWVFSGVDGRLLYTLEGLDGTRFGAAIADVGDRDGDGATEFIVSAPEADLGGGRTYIFDGKDGAFIASNFGVLERFGSSVTGGRDIDGDATPDYAVGAPFFVDFSGRVAVLSGATGRFVHLLFGDVPGGRFGATVSLIEDVDGDARADIAVGQPGFEPECTHLFEIEICEAKGRALVYSGRTGRLIRAIPGAFFNRFGNTVAGDVDLDGDGRAEVIVGGFPSTLNGFSFFAHRARVAAYSYSAPGACADLDGDGYGGASGTEECPSPGIDCDDADASINPGILEIGGNGIDDNCNGLVDEAPWCSVAKGADANPWAAAPLVALFEVLAMMRAIPRKRASERARPG